jgi:hypothetical protein
VTENLEHLSEDDLERMLLEATSEGVPGRAAMARVTAIRTLLRRRAQRPADDAETRARQALELVNATRGPEAQLSEVHPVWVESILAEPAWAEVYTTDEETQRTRTTT